MQTTVGNGETQIKSFAVDFGDKDIHIGRKKYPKGYFANAVLNLTPAEVTELLTLAAPAYHAQRDIRMYGYRDDYFAYAKESVLALKKKLFSMIPFSLLDVRTEEQRLQNVFCEDGRLLLQDYWSLLKQKGAVDADLTPEEALLASVGRMHMEQLLWMLNFYVYVPMDIANFNNAILNLEQDKLRDLKKRDAHHYAAACNAFFSNPELPRMLYEAQISKEVAGFSLKPNARQEFVVLSVPGKRGAKMVSRRLHFCRLMDFLVADFFEGLAAGHAPKRCAICGRFFLTTDARPRKYCTGYTPNDPCGRSCQAVGARKSREDREKAANHPVKSICETRCNTIDHHIRQGKIDKEFGTAAKKIARRLRDRAIRDNEYLLGNYPQDMTSEAIYEATQRALGRPPKRERL